MNKIWQWIIGLLAVFGAVTKVRLSNAQKDAAEKDRDLAESSLKARKNADEALVRGLNEESKPVDRKYFGD